MQPYMSSYYADAPIFFVYFKNIYWGATQLPLNFSNYDFFTTRLFYLPYPNPMLQF